LEKTLWGYECQTRKADEIIIADDGSGEETRSLILSFAGRLPIKHVWHEDRGFRKTEILNKALLASTAEYLIFTDHDCIPRRDFIATHERFARRGYILSGGYFKLPMSISRAIGHDDIVSGRAFSLSWLRSLGLPLSFKNTKLLGKEWYARLLNAITPAKATWNGCNASGWRDDMLAVNGFNEKMRYGGLDREFGERLFNMGIKAVQIRYSAIVLHLDHKRPYKTPESIRANRDIRRDIRRRKVVKTPFGIEKL